MYRSLLVIVLVFATGAQAQSPAVAELWSQSTLYRDEWGVPHVYADTPRALAFAFGYAQAEDHVEAMLMAYRVANGRAAEVLGEAYAPSDEFAIMMNHAGLAAQAFAAADSITRDLCDGFALGVNTWLVDHAGQAPAWADGVRPPDILALLHCYLMSFAPFDLPDAFHRPPAAMTGNAWALAPAHSRTGETILAINPHTDYNSPFQWYEAQLSCQDLNTSGATLFGLPVILQGYNGLLGWALSPNDADSADVYIEPDVRIARKPGVQQAANLPTEAMLYEYLMAASRPYYVSMPYGMETRKAQRLDTPRGPVVGKYNGHMCSLKAGGYRDFGTIAQLVEMGRAQTMEEFQAALRMQQLPCFHIVYADRAGNIFALYNATLGNKPAGQLPPATVAAKNADANVAAPTIADWTKPVPADDPRFNWGDTVPIDLLPVVVNPASGYVQACGTPPWGVTADSGMNAGDWPAWFARDPDSLRARRARRLLAMGPRSFQDAQAMLYDTVVPAAVEAAPLLLRAAELAPDFVANAHPDLAGGLDLLRNWHYAAETDTAAMTFFRVWWATLQAMAGPVIQGDAALVDALAQDTPQSRDLALRAASEAAKQIRNQFQTLSVPWGDVHTIQRGERSEPLQGASSGAPIFVAADAAFVNNRWPVTYGYGFAMVVKFGELPEAVSMVPFGASEDPQSPHFDDQLDLMVQRRFKRTRFLQDDVLRNCERARGQSIRLRPAGMDALFTLNAQAPVEARIRIEASAPGPLPDGLTPFTVYVRPEWAPETIPLTATMEITIPDVLCAAEHLVELAIYAYDAKDGWTRVPGQQVSPEARTFRAQDTAAHVYAVLGPAEDRPSVAPTGPSPDSAPPLLAAAPTETPPWLKQEAAPTIRRFELPLTAPQAVEKGLAELTPKQPAQGPPPLLEPPRPNEEAPAAAPAVAEPEPVRKPSRLARILGKGKRPKSKEPDANTPFQTPETSGAATAAPAPQSPSSAAPTEPANAAPGATPTPSRTAAAPSPAAVPPPPGSEVGAPLQGPAYPSVSAWGREVQLQPPTMDGLLVLRLPVVAKVTLFASDDAPGPLPTGQAAFTKFLGFRFSSRLEDAEVAISLHLPEAVCSAENLAKLAIYAFDDKNGWVRLPGQKLAAESRTFSGIDIVPRPYVILGPADCLLAAGGKG